MSAPISEQRWRGGRSTFVPPSERFDARAFDVAEISTDTPAKTFVVEHHYSGTYPAARWRFGLYMRGALVGVAVFSHPCADIVLTSVFPGRATDSVELGRFVLLDDVRFNGETWFLARAFDLLRVDGVRGVVSFSDPMPRATRAGDVVFAGHIGTIYQAHNATYLGCARPRSIRLLPDGRTFSARAISKIRAGERGWEYSVAQLVAAGAAARSPDESLRAWLDLELPRVTRVTRHPGNHKYAWAINRRARRALPSSMPYPRQAASVGLVKVRA